MKKQMIGAGVTRSPGVGRGDSDGNGGTHSDGTHSYTPPSIYDIQSQNLHVPAILATQFLNRLVAVRKWFPKKNTEKPTEKFGQKYLIRNEGLHEYGTSS